MRFLLLVNLGHIAYGRTHLYCFHLFVALAVTPPRFRGPTRARLAPAMADKGGEPPVATSAVLYAAARELSRVCGRVNAEFLACKAKDGNPAACLAEVGLGGPAAAILATGLVPSWRGGCSGAKDRARRGGVARARESVGCAAFADKIDDEWVCVVATSRGAPFVSERAWFCAGAHLAVSAAVGRQCRGEDILSTVSEQPSWSCP